MQNCWTHVKTAKITVSARFHVITFVKIQGGGGSKRKFFFGKVAKLFFGDNSDPALYQQSHTIWMPADKKHASLSGPVIAKFCCKIFCICS